MPPKVRRAPERTRSASRAHPPPRPTPSRATRRAPTPLEGGHRPIRSAAGTALRVRSRCSAMPRPRARRRDRVAPRQRARPPPAARPARTRPSPGRKRARPSVRRAPCDPHRGARETGRKGTVCRGCGRRVGRRRATGARLSSSHLPHEPRARRGVAPRRRMRRPLFDIGEGRAVRERALDA